MTLPASGAISASEINVELGRSSTATFSMDGAEERALAGDASGAISFSTFHGKSNVGSVAFLEAYTGSGTSLAGVSFGTAAANRRIIISLAWQGSATTGQSISSVTIGGVSATVHVGTGNRNTATNQTVGVAIASAIVPTGTSGTVSFTMSTGSITDTHVASFRGIGLPTSPTDTADDTANESTKPATGSLNVPQDGFVIMNAGLSGLGTPSLSGPASSAFLNGDFGTRYETGMSANADFPVSATWDSGDSGMVMSAVSWAVA